MIKVPNNKMDKIINLCKRRGFIFPGSEIYGGLANSWDYGPLGVELKNNIKNEWWKIFVQQRTDVVGLDAALIMNPKVWEASGHTGKGFADPLTECKECHKRFRADQINTSESCPNCGAKESFTEPKMFNILMETHLGSVEGEKSLAYLRGETAQSMFVDFKLVADTMRKKLPFGIAQIGKSFRNEITPGNFIFRTREFEQMEIEYFVKESDWEDYFHMWQDQMISWLTHLGVNLKNVHFEEISEEKRAHYSSRTIDIEYDFPFGQSELYGLAYRGDFDLKTHMEHSGKDLSYTDPDSGQKIIPHVIEPSFGVDRSLLVALLEAYHEEDAPTADKDEAAQRIVLKFPKWSAPIKVAVLPLSKKEELTEVAKSLYEKLTKQFACEYDETQSIGRRYRRQDEIGTPYCVTIDFDSLTDKAVTVRDRDTMKQERVAINKLENYLAEKLIA
ncbi:MAG: glycine--tRNA ligase [bacterium]|nr:glycine--tRNA ligase [bacterium]